MTKIIRNAKQLAEAKEELEDLKKAKKKILQAQSYTTDVNQITRASLKEVSEEISAYEEAIDAYEQHGSTKRRAKRVVPIG
jgi:archaellum component FlaC